VAVAILAARSELGGVPAAAPASPKIPPPCPIGGSQSKGCGIHCPLGREVTVPRAKGPTTKSHRATASFGKRQEFIAIAKLLEEGFDVYQTLVDDQQIDCVIRGKKGQAPVYIDIQVKARSENADKKSWGVWPSIKVLDPRPNLFFVFYSQPLEGAYWVVPSEYLVANSYRVKTPKYEGHYTVTLVTATSGGDRDNPSFSRFKNTFQALHDYIRKARAT
jgi:hypothetical protein